MALQVAIFFKPGSQVTSQVASTPGSQPGQPAKLPAKLPVSQPASKAASRRGSQAALKKLRASSAAGLLLLGPQDPPQSLHSNVIDNYAEIVHAMCECDAKPMGRRVREFGSKLENSENSRGEEELANAKNSIPVLASEAAARRPSRPRQSRAPFLHKK